MISPSSGPASPSPKKNVPRFGYKMRWLPLSPLLLPSSLPRELSTLRLLQPPLLLYGGPKEASKSRIWVTISCSLLFDSETKVDTILANTPGSFDKHLMILQKYDGVSKVKDLDFNSTLFWIQLHNLPVKFITTTVAKMLCEPAGQVLKLPNAKTEECGGFMRVQVMVDISQPLCRGKVVALDDSRELCVSFKYERLPNLCYWCGRLTHNDRDCDRWIESEGSLNDANKEYKTRLKASPWSGARNSVVELLGFYSKMKAECLGQRRSDETGNSTATRVMPTTPTSNMLQATYGSSFSDLVKADSFQNNSQLILSM